MLQLHDIGRLPSAQDNCAIAIQSLNAGTAVNIEGNQATISHTILEGHRFAIQPIPAGSPLLSWGMPFGRALHHIAPGEYVCNENVLDELRGRAPDFDLPSRPNFADDLAEYQFDADRFQPAPRLPTTRDPRTFMGIRRPGKRGVGTRNTIVLLGVNALVAGFVRQLEKEVKALTNRCANIDDIVAVVHTEGSQAGSNNQPYLLRSLAGYMVHPNVGAVLVIDAGHVGVTNDMLRELAGREGYAVDDVLHHFMSLRGPFAADLTQGKEIIKNWLPQVNAMGRTPQPLSELKIALQCGGSDAFSGISGNPLAAWVSKEVIQAGGSAVLAETDELIGAESYVLQKVSDEATAERFLEMVARFQKRVAWHGYSAKGNPSGGNKYRGLYNIYLKSLGAAAKRHPDVRLDYVIEYGERMGSPGYYFMDSPGNDLESIAGQVAAGCNLIFFVTGNGSITNFPFVPTIKIVTTSQRYALLSEEMDVNAGKYLDGIPLAEVGRSTIDLTLDIASGQPSAGEKASHAQVQIWRNWQQSDYVDIEKIKELSRPASPDGKPLVIQPPAEPIHSAFSAWQTETHIASDRVGLILPSSLCSGQVASMAVKHLNELAIGREKQISRFVALVHTEGCGSPTLPEFVDPLLGYLRHPSVATCLILEHGCEMTHNDFWRGRLRKAGLNPERYGWASVQLDGGIERVIAKMEAWFAADCAQMASPQAITADLSRMRLGIMSEGITDDGTASALAYLIQQVVVAGGTIILPANDPLAMSNAFAKVLQVDLPMRSTLAFAHQPHQPGYHIMANGTSQWAETMTGLGATGIGLILAVISSRSQQGHPFIPVLQVAAETAVPQPFHADIDVVVSGSARQRVNQIITLVSRVLSRKVKTKLTQKGNITFQISRGPLGISF
ncbi:MAG: UxaA family hydrolase [Ardenticatenaceae bacterium]|nr:UxaA family hydrolase [Ardenticatenaceae bacterium]